ncbi:unnamed protein product [Eruca vesicaria subsp. sativa]|uniref:Uncharacterized protein n=1 Tax=Eruca vesicaria subsp. sativa TaxID=29727 RepID=A0ABC8KYW1_ERUVS|nr:unnamed protein product [Eruca vesicaria subsp. sativa]
MAISFHVRSNSFPSRLHPQAAHVDEQLIRLRSSEEASTSSSSSICKRLNNLQELHQSLEKLIRLPATQQALAQDQNKATEQLLDGSLKILDLCNISKDTLSQMKEYLKEIQSILRRKRGNLSGEIKKYLASRRSLKKSFQKVLKSLKVKQDLKCIDESLAVFGEAEAISMNLFDSLFYFMYGSKTCSKWSLVSKLINQKKVSCEAQANEFTKVDFEFQSEKTLKMEDVQVLESCIQDLEDGLESLSKSLIKYRVSILNIIGQ